VAGGILPVLMLMRQWQPFMSPGPPAAVEGRQMREMRDEPPSP
jgi:hypothetical protein